MTKNWKKRALSFLLAGVMVLTMGGFIKAKADEPKTGDDDVYSDTPPTNVELIIQKLQYTNNLKDIQLDKNDGVKPAEGKTKSGQDLNKYKYDKNKYGEVEFSIFELDTKKVQAEGETINYVNVAKAVEKAFNEGDASTAYGAKKVGESVSVDENGQAKFKSVPAGDNYYVIVETKAPSTATTKAVPMFLQLPLTSEKGDKFLSKVYLEAKNQMTPNTVKILKQDENGNAIQGIEFALYKGEAPNGIFVSKTPTDEQGNIDISDLELGQKYYLVEVETDSKVDGLEVEATKYNPRANVGTRLAHKNALNDAENKLGFELTYDKGVVVAEGNNLWNDAIKTFTLKNHQRPKITKVIDGGDDNGKSASVSKDETINFTVTLNVPKNIEEYTKFEYEDMADDGLKIDASTVTVEGLEKKDYTVEATATGYKINFVVGRSISENVKNKKGSNLTIKYTGTVTKEVSQELNNTVNLTYNKGGKDRYDTDKVVVKTYGKKFVKKDAGRFGILTEGQGLVGAKFVIKNAENKYLAKTGDPESKYTWADQYDDKVIVLTSGQDGTFEINGLKKGTYKLEEIKAPDGFRRLLNPVEFKVGENTEEDAKVLEVKNTRNPELPLTGKEKLLVYGGVGTLLVGVAFLVLRKKKGNKTEE